MPGKLRRRDESGSRRVKRTPMKGARDSRLVIWWMPRTPQTSKLGMVPMLFHRAQSKVRSSNSGTGSIQAPRNPSYEISFSSLQVRSLRKQHLIGEEQYMGLKKLVLGDAICKL